jgi:1-acyl-sn-glycerol-3-phosphate acyltransferase
MRIQLSTAALIVWRSILLALISVPTGMLVLAVLCCPWPSVQRAIAQHGTRYVCQLIVAAVGINSVRRGPLPARGSLLVANHLSWIDIISVLAAYQCTFVAKHEVQTWPVVGILGNALGVIWIDRRRTKDIVRVLPQVENTLRAGQSVLLFAEGTTSNGRTVLPFYTGLFQSAVTAGAPVVPMALSGSASHGDVDALCWYNEEALIRNLPRLIALRGTTLTWHVGAPIPSTASWANRKHIARDARTQVLRRFTAIRRESC